MQYFDVPLQSNCSRIAAGALYETARVRHAAWQRRGWGLDVRAQQTMHCVRDICFCERAVRQEVIQPHDPIAEISWCWPVRKVPLTPAEAAQRGAGADAYFSGQGLVLVIRCPVG
jgi:hypothetical protein